MRRSMLAVPLLFALPLAFAQQTRIPQYRSLPGTFAVAAGPNSSLYLISTPARFPPTPGSWRTSCAGQDAFSGNEVILARVSEDLSTVFWSTCLPFSNSSVIRVDPRTGAIVVAGSPNPNFVPTSASAPAAGVRTNFGIIRVLPDGATSDLAWLAFPPSPPLYNLGSPGLSGLAVFPDSSLMIATNTTPGLSATPDAASLSPGPGYLFRLSADGSHVLYATYMPASITGLASTAAGKVWLTGQIDGRVQGFAGFNTRLTLPFGSATPLSGESFVASFDPSTQKFTSFANFGIITSELDGLRININPNGRPVLVMKVFDGTVFLAGFELNELGTQPIVSQRVTSDLSPQDLAFDADGNWIVLDSYSFSPLPVTAESKRLSPYYGLSGFLRLSASGNGVVSTTVIQDQTAENVITTPDGTILVSVIYPHATPLHPEMSAPEPVSVSKPPGSFLFFAYPKIVEVCKNSDLPPVQYLSWDVRDVSPGTTIEVHSGSATGPILATGNTGVIPRPAGNNTYVLVSNPNGGPFLLPRQLASETTSLNTQPLRCSYLDRQATEVSIRPNPVVSCADPAFTGTAVQVTSAIPSGLTVAPGLLQIRVGVPLGPLFTAHLGGINETTGDWVRNGMDFFLSSESAPETVLASNRAYVLPVRDCRAKTPPPPAIQATRDCAKQNTFTLAYFTGEPDPVAIRVGAPDGPIVALQDGLYDGLTDIVTDTRTAYFLTTLQNGVWQSLASTVADPAQPCGQGRPHE